MKITLFKSFLLLGALLSFGLVKGQTVTGTVSDQSGPLPGANVLVKGTTNGTQTDFDGNYSLDNVQSNATLVFSYIGYKRVEVPLNGRTTVDINMEEDASELEEVVLIGYGTQRRSDLTGAVGSVNEEKLRERPATSLNQALSGKISGVQVNTNSGRPGGKA